MEYLFFKDGGKTYHYRYQYPAECWPVCGKQRKKSLRTENYGEACRRRALELQYDLLVVNCQRDTLARESPEHRPVLIRRLVADDLGIMHFDDGSFRVADEQRVTWYGADGTRKAESPNVYRVFDVAPERAWPLADRRKFEKAKRDAGGDLDDFSTADYQPRVRRDLKTLNKRIIDAWAAEPNRKGEPRDAYQIKECHDTYAIFALIVPGKTFADATRSDGRALARHLGTLVKENSSAVRRGKESATAKSGTVAKKVGWLRAACNLAIDRPEDFPEMANKANPFTSVAKLLEDEDDRDIYTDDEMRKIFAKRDQFETDEWRLWVMLATTGMRLSEPFQIAGEENLEGHRCVFFGSKTKNSKRRVIVPKRAEPYLPSLIEGALFTKSSKVLGKSLREKLREIVPDLSKTPHSLRHRVETKLDWADTRESVIDTILGHRMEDFKGNHGTKPRNRSIRQRYFNGNHPDKIAMSLNLITIGDD